jgi:hypothetical protein
LERAKEQNEKTFAICLGASYIYQSSIFFLRLASQKIRIGFTVENAEHFISVIESKGVKVSTRENKRRENTAGLFPKQ